MLTPLKVAGVGAGYFAQFHYEAWQRMQRVEPIALCDLDQNKAQTMAKRFGVAYVFRDAAAMLKSVQPDLLDIVTPPETHLGLVQLAAEHQLPVICQKPLAPTLAEAQAVVAVAEDAGILLVVHENFRFQPWFQELRRLLQSGMIGTCYSASFRLRPGDGQGPDAYLSRQPYFQKMERFLIHETGIHFIDTFRFLFGEVSSVYAELRRLNPVIAGEDSGTVLCEFRNSVSVLFDGNRLVDHEAEDTRLTMGEMLIEGAAGVLRLNGQGRIFFRKYGEQENEHEYAWESCGFAGDCVFSCQSHVVSHLLNGTQFQNSGREYLRNLELEEAIYESHRQQRRMQV